MMERIFNLLIPQNLSKDPIEFSYAKNFVGACIISLFASPIYIVLYILLHDKLAAYAIVIAEVGMLGSLIILKYARSLFLASAMFITALTALLFWLTYHLGGIYSATAFWLILPPLIACFIGGIKSGYFWCTISIIATTCLFVTGNFELYLPASPVTHPLLLHYTAIVGLNLVIISLLYFYEIGKKSSLEKLHYIAYHDVLTGFPNRSAYEVILEKAIQRAKKYATSFSVFYLDIDNFKKINAVFGHQVGDLLLKEIAERLKRYINHSANIVRIGGDEFKIVLEINPNDDLINEISNVMLTTLKIPFHVKNNEINITASVGVATYPINSAEEIAIDQNVDIALSQAKALGGDRCQLFTESLAQSETNKILIEKQLLNAVLNNELSIHYQPQFDTKDVTKIIGMEALLRWHNPVIGEVPSSIFIPVAERINIISQLGEWVLRQACSQYVQWLHMGIVNNSISLAINVSARQLYSESFISTIEQIIYETGMPPHNLELELTETAIISDELSAIITIQKLSEMGIRTVIDDFGSGYTSLSYLTMLPVSGIKLDKAFADNMFGMHSSTCVIESLIDLAHKINLKVIVEGVENVEQLNFLQAIDSDCVQGFYLSKPLNDNDMQLLLTTHYTNQKT